MAFAYVRAIRLTVLDDLPAYGFARIIGAGAFGCRGADPVPGARIEALEDDGSGLFAAAPSFNPTKVYIQVGNDGAFAGSSREFALDITSDADAERIGALRMGVWSIGIDNVFPAGSVMIELISSTGNVVASFTSTGDNSPVEIAIGGDYPILTDYIFLDSDDGHRDLPATVDSPYDHVTSEIWYAVVTPSGSASGTLTVDTTASGSGVDTYIGIWDSAFSLIASGTNAPSGPSLITASVLGNATYYVGITTRAPYLTGPPTSAASSYNFIRDPVTNMGGYLDVAAQVDVSYTDGGAQPFWDVLTGSQEVV